MTPDQFLPSLIERIQARVVQLDEEVGEDYHSQLMVDLMSMLGVAQEFNDYLNGEVDFEDQLEVAEQALALMTQVIEEARQDVLTLVAASNDKEATTWH
tara:strand:+ start:3792 stop:4088 length:297 start_codon:yes stop_codon:yes gene_type:complete